MQAVEVVTALALGVPALLGEGLGWEDLKAEDLRASATASIVPTEGAAAPAESAPTPAEGAPPPAEGMPPPAEGTAPPAEGTPAPGDSAGERAD